MKKTVFFLLILLIGCGENLQEYTKAENALDAGREFINACLTGDFAKAAFFIDSRAGENLKLQEIERKYRLKDKEERQQYRTASINIREVKELNDSITLIYFSNSVDKVSDSLAVVKQKDNWRVKL